MREHAGRPETLTDRIDAKHNCYSVVKELL
jgi:hypothetical protein